MTNKRAYLCALLTIALASCDDDASIIGAMNPDAAGADAAGARGTINTSDTGGVGAGPASGGGDAPDTRTSIDAPVDAADDSPRDTATDVVADTMTDTRCPAGFRTVTLQPGAEGKDAPIFSLQPDVSHADYPFLRADGWTWDGVPGAQRSLLQFDLPDEGKDEVVNAILTLYANPVPGVYGGHEALQGVTNEAWLLRVTSPWDEQVTWSNQPDVLEPASGSGAILLPASQSETQTYKVDVTTFIAPMSAGILPNYGFLLRMVTELPYRQLNFCSSDNPEAPLRPTLTIRYQCH